MHDDITTIRVGGPPEESPAPSPPRGAPPENRARLWWLLAAAATPWLVAGALVGTRLLADGRPAGAP